MPRRNSLSSTLHEVYSSTTEDKMPATSPAPQYSLSVEDFHIFGSDKRLSLTLRSPLDNEFPSTSPEITATPPAATEPTRIFRIRQNARPIKLALSAWLLALIFTILYSLFIHRVLIAGNPIIGDCVFEASLTNLLLSIFSQLYAMLLGYVVMSLSDAMRWSLAARPGGKGGTSATSFFQLSPATDWFSVLKFMIASRLRNHWGLIRLSLPFMGLGFGSVLKFQNSFEYDFIAYGPTIPVYAGTIPPEMSVLNNIPPSYLDGFFDTWSQQLLNYPRYATKWQIDGCDGDCTVAFLPGGMEIARQVTPLLNSTILQSGLFNNAESIRLERAPGMAVRFDPLPKDVAFDLKDDCSIYLTPLNDGLQICTKQHGSSIAAAWRGCETVTQVIGNCSDPAHWASPEFKTRTLLTTYRQNATSMYAQKDLSIQKVVPESDPELVTLFASDLRRIWDRLFLPSPFYSTLDLESINVTISRLAWKYRTYTEFFPDNNIHIEQLQNFLSVPMQFAITALQYANYTFALPPDKRQFPVELLTTATGGRPIERFVSKMWTAWTFIVAGCTVMLLSGIGFAWILSQEHPVPRPSGIVEMDFATRLGDLQPFHGDPRERQGGFGELVDDVQAGEYSVWRLIRKLRGRRMGLIPVQTEDKDGASKAVPVLHTWGKTPTRVCTADTMQSSETVWGKA